MKIQAFGCTHGFHESIQIKEVDMLIHTGDESNSRNPTINYNESMDFLKWYASQNIKYKIFIAGNHSTAIEARLITPKKINDMGIIYLEHSHIEIEGLKIFGSPYTPKFGSWAFMKDRSKMDKLWKTIENDSDIIISHGPPHSVLDLSVDTDRTMEMCGDKSLYNHCKRVQPSHVFFSHIHNRGYINNRGTKVEENINYHNVNCVEDSKFDFGLQSSGIIINI